MHGLETIIRRNNDAAERLLGEPADLLKDWTEANPIIPIPAPTLPIDDGDSDES